MWPGLVDTRDCRDPAWGKVATPVYDPRHPGTSILITLKFRVDGLELWAASRPSLNAGPSRRSTWRA